MRVVVDQRTVKHIGVFLQQPGNLPSASILLRASLWVGTGIALALLLAPTLAWAGEAAPPDRQDALRGLAQRLVDRVGTKLEDADALLAGDSLKDRQAQQQLEGIPDGETLILQTTLAPRKAADVARFTAPDPLLAIKQGKQVYFDFSEFVRIAGFGITYDAATQSATGWAYREDQPFVLDLAASQVTVNGATQALKPDDTLVQDDILYVRSALLEDWFVLSIDNSPQAQATTIISGETLTPTQERIFRRDRRAKEIAKAPPEKPRLEQPAQIFSQPRADVTLAQEIRRSGDSESNRDINRSTYNVLATNETLGHETTAFLSGSNENKLDQLRLNFVKESENNDLLGPLRAKVYEIGDHASVRVPYSGASSLERGLRVSNRGERFTVDSATTVDGNAQPGWDVELYRNDSFVDGQTVGDDGYYQFDNVQLFAGDNTFKIVLFGPQGEVREETRLITVAPNLIGSVKGYYDLSLSQKGEITYRADDSDSADTGTPRLAATYDRRVGDNLTLRGGVHSQVTRDQRDNYFYSGAATALGQTLYNADMITTSDGPFSTILQARRRLGKHNASATARHNSENFSETFIDEELNPVLALTSVDAGLQGPWLPSVFAKTSYDAGAGVARNTAGTTYLSGNFGLSSSFMGMRFNNRMTTRQVSGGDGGSTGSTDNRTTYDGSVFGRYKSFQWQSGWSYAFQPEAEPLDYNLRLTKKFNRDTNGSLETRHTFTTRLTSVTATANYTAEKATFSPSLSYDSDSNMRAYMSVNFSLMQDPYSKDVVMTSRRVGGQGGLSVMAFLDNGGDGVFSEGDQPLPDVVINLKQLNRDLITGEDGQAFAYDLGTTRVTDVVMEESTAFEPSWVSGFEGVSFRPRPGDVTRLEFPVLRGAEMDGTAGIRTDTGVLKELSGVTLRLETPDGVVAKETTTPFDGFFVIEAIKPGVYYLTTDSSQSPATAYRVPEKVIVTPQGAQIYGKSLALTRGYDMRFRFIAANANPALARRTKITRAEDIAREDIFIRLGNFRSSLAASLSWYKFKLRTRDWQNPLVPVADDFDDIARDEKTGRLPLLLKPKNPLRLEEAALLCERLIDAGFENCGVDVVTTYHDGKTTAQDTPVTTSGQG